MVKYWSILTMSFILALCLFPIFPITHLHTKRTPAAHIALHVLSSPHSASSSPPFLLVFISALLMTPQPILMSVGLEPQWFGIPRCPISFVVRSSCRRVAHEATVRNLLAVSSIQSL